jgi:histone acetyltransferase (RNA polymerase elongator complex component)
MLKIRAEKNKTFEKPKKDIFLRFQNDIECLLTCFSRCKKAKTIRNKLTRKGTLLSGLRLIGTEYSIKKKGHDEGNFKFYV